ncbi:uncharacterized protein K452DRAFT_118418 [Aplosporella prunicola CBS 121167]|uniref:Phosphoglycerate mutase family protein n=1 Tax=Aplosporella prunicola CBS 121167 TaxID=1176127 RepID=A0A6A6BQ13_9PEZI|nr:uncharacterized protein K452DRAFT_118418 [Aplosporella prunicola CBS 121167]KAF2145324.1 hypothetical protein K452DRAFT_118418 [Aplosporella prunicola CBS 121167]
MPPVLYLVRHAQGYHNINRQHHLRDPELTPLGTAQCGELRAAFPHHDRIDVVMASPLKRTVQTAALAFEPALRRPNVPFLLVPWAQEIAANACDVGQGREELEGWVRGTFAEMGVRVEPAKVDYGLVEEGWNSKTGIYEPRLSVVEKRAASLRTWLWQRPEATIVLVAHGAFLHYFTEDWTAFDPKKGTAFENCEYRKYTFSADSNASEAHLVEHGVAQVKQGRPPGVHANVLAEIEAVEANP